MDGFYSIWSKPYLENKKTKEYDMQDFEVLTMVLSALKWQEHSGKTKMIADKPALTFLEKKGLLDIFQDGVEELSVPEEISTKVFWAAGKLYALRKMEKPSVMIDLDLIIWKNMNEWFQKGDICVIHREEITPHVYPEPSFFHMKEGFSFPEDYDFHVLPCNTAMLYYKNVDFKNYYADSAISFMTECRETQENLKHMVFAEQRMLSICAKQKKQAIVSVFPLASDIGDQDLFTHVWGHKNILRYNYQERKNFCHRILKRLQTEHGDVYEKIKKLPEYANYL